MNDVQKFTFQIFRTAGQDAAERALAAMKQNPRRDLSFLLIRAAVKFASDPRYDLQKGYSK